MRVLVVEDDEGIASGLLARLPAHGCAVDAVLSVEAAWSALRVEPFDIVLLDLGLGGADGTELLRRLRSAPQQGLPDPHTPVLIMTARDAVTSRITGLDMGADDYVIKPFDVDELAARMRAARRRFAGRSQSRLRCGPVEIEPAQRTVHREGHPVELSAREFDVLLALAEARPRVLSRAQIEARLYNWDQAVESNAVEVHIHHLRRKLGAELIRTMRGVGYFMPSEGSA
ncbi:response regulator transcription factor [Schlegelella sp. S2-27]|uniref:Response regulator transcription factor n=1 Tax=Caldimonas mangrovi TaxID=2944811 RepID=A0ABT0YR43_9BURK|nr:response regulator transcription factor [Caldimonas mangrovi]MCM5681206.1 response regulator transcription factor [Caldimonas mangrovi]